MLIDFPVLSRISSNTAFVSACYQKTVCWLIKGRPVVLTIRHWKMFYPIAGLMDKSPHGPGGKKFWWSGKMAHQSPSSCWSIPIQYKIKTECAMNHPRSKPTVILTMKANTVYFYLRRQTTHNTIVTSLDWQEIDVPGNETDDSCQSCLIIASVENTYNACLPNRKL